MKNVINKFILLLSLISIALFIAGYIILEKYFPDFNIINFEVLIILFFIVTTFFHIFLIKSSNKKVTKFINRFLSVTGIKLLVYLIIIVLYIFLNKEAAPIFLVIFLILYVVYTFIEVSSILKFIKKEEKK